MPTAAKQLLQNRSRTGLFANRLVRELFVVIAVKLLVLYGLWFAFFRQPDVSPPTVEQVSAALAGHSTSSSGPRNARGPDPQ